jgi:hypothetical protein
MWDSMCTRIPSWLAWRKRACKEALAKCASMEKSRTRRPPQSRPPAQGNASAAVAPTLAGRPEVRGRRLSCAASTDSSGGTRRQGGITKAGNTTARRMLIEAAWSYRFPARISREQLLQQEALPKPIRDIAWKAQERLCRRYRRLARSGKLTTVICAAIARELAGFVWAIACEVGRSDSGKSACKLAVHRVAAS